MPVWTCPEAKRLILKGVSSQQGLCVSYQLHKYTLPLLTLKPFELQIQSNLSLFVQRTKVSWRLHKQKIHNHDYLMFSDGTEAVLSAPLQWTGLWVWTRCHQERAVGPSLSEQDWRQRRECFELSANSTKSLSPSWWPRWGTPTPTSFDASSPTTRRGWDQRRKKDKNVVK